MGKYNSGYEFGRRATLEAKLLRNDPTLALLVINLRYDEDFHGIIEALQNNTIVESIDCYVFDDLIQNLTPLYNCIRARGQLRKLKFQDFTGRFNISDLLEAASESSCLQMLDIVGSYIYTPESLGRLRSHPSLREICFAVPCIPQIIVDNFRAWSHEEVVEKAKVYGQIIETCPRMQQVRIQCKLFTMENWEPICKALYLVHPEVTFELIGATSFDAEATEHLRSFLNKCPNPVHLCTYMPLVSNLVGSSVHSLSIYSYQVRSTGDCLSVKPEWADLRKTLTQGQNNSLRVMKFYGFYCPDNFSTFFDCIPDLRCVEEFYVSFTDVEIDSHENSFMKKQFLTSLMKSSSIQKFELKFGCYGDADSVWTDAEIEILQSVLFRNKSIPSLLATPYLIPLSLWPDVFQAFQKTNAAMSLIYQGLRRGLSVGIIASCGSDDAC
jgi:hypothetical protein